MHWHVKPQFSRPDVPRLTDFVTYWHLTEAEESAASLERAKKRLGYTDFGWAIIECESLECLIDALAC